VRKLLFSGIVGLAALVGCDNSVEQAPVVPQSTKAESRPIVSEPRISKDRIITGKYISGEPEILQVNGDDYSKFGSALSNTPKGVVGEWLYFRDIRNNPGYDTAYYYLKINKDHSASYKEEYFREIIDNSRAENNIISLRTERVGEGEKMSGTWTFDNNTLEARMHK
jgi:hypothetical protein